jgi:ribosomal protein S12 methylthiotransferase accessory factor
VFETCEELLVRDGDPRIFTSVPKPAFTERFLYGPMPAAGGAGFTRASATRRAMGECMERYAASTYVPDELVYGSQKELGPSAVGFDEFRWYSEAQKNHPELPFARPRPEAPIYWARGTLLGTDQVRYVPACLVYLSYQGHADDLFTLAVSTGTACHEDVTQATLAGLHEVIERDAFMIAWLRRLPLQRIRFEESPPLALLYQRHLQAPGLRYHVFDMTTDLRVPSVLCVIEGQAQRGPMVAVGAATRGQEERAVEKAMLEAASDLLYARALVRRKPAWRPDAEFRNVREFEDHVRLFCEPEMKPHLDFLVRGEKARPVAPDPDLTDPQTELAHVERLLAGAGLQAIVVDLTTRDLRAAGYACVKVLVPGAVPLTSIHGLTPVGPPRLHTVPKALGYDLPEGGFHRIPHPFP